MAFVALAASLALAPSAMADTYGFAFNGNGVSGSGTLTVALTGPNGAYTVTGITGVFADANAGFSGTISGLEFAPPPVFNLPPDPAGTFGAPAFSDAGFSYDNLFYADGQSPAICAEALNFFGGVFDIYGVVFDVTGAGNVDTVDMWSDGVSGGYRVGDSYQGTKLGESAGNGYSVAVTAAPVPEPSSLLLLGTGLPGLVAVFKRKRSK